MPISPDLAIFVVTTMTTMTDDRRQTKPIALRLVHVCGVINASLI